MAQTRSSPDQNLIWLLDCEPCEGLPKSPYKEIVHNIRGEEKSINCSTVGMPKSLNKKIRLFKGTVSVILVTLHANMTMPDSQR